MSSRDFALSRGEAEVVGASSYLVRTYRPADTTRGATISLYVGYYAQQMQGRTVHSPKNCLPGAGWEPLSSRPDTVATDRGPVVVNRYLIQNGGARALVFYWYQGRGRVAHDEYGVKWDLLRDAALKRRSDEALVRIVVPLRATEAEAEALAVRATREVVPAVYAALPA
jgi:EpsI family protein